jgi:hypothetical protein
MKLSIYSNDPGIVLSYRYRPQAFFLPAEISKFQLTETGLRIPGTGALVMDLEVKRITDKLGEAVDIIRMDAQALFFLLRNPNYLAEYEIIETELR